jgi:hypothetical protein
MSSRRPYGSWLAPRIGREHPDFLCYSLYFRGAGQPEPGGIRNHGSGHPVLPGLRRQEIDSLGGDEKLRGVCSAWLAGGMGGSRPGTGGANHISAPTAARRVRGEHKTSRLRARPGRQLTLPGWRRGACARPDTGQAREPGHVTAPENPAPDHGLPGNRNVGPKRENGPH